MDEEYEETQIVSYSPTAYTPGKFSRIVISNPKKVKLPETVNPLEHFFLRDYYSGVVSVQAYLERNNGPGISFIFEVKKEADGYRYDLIQRHLIRGRDFLLKSHTSKQLLEGASPSLDQIVQSLKPSHPDITVEEFSKLFDNAKLEINEFYTKCSIGDKVIYVDYSSRDFHCEAKLEASRRLVCADTLEDYYWMYIWDLLEGEAKSLENRGEAPLFINVTGVLFSQR
jgi:hypothetical protein